MVVPEDRISMIVLGRVEPKHVPHLSISSAILVHICLNQVWFSCPVPQELEIQLIPCWPCTIFCAHLHPFSSHSLYNLPTTPIQRQRRKHHNKYIHWFKETFFNVWVVTIGHWCWEITCLIKKKIYNLPTILKINDFFTLWALEHSYLHGWLRWIDGTNWNIILLHVKWISEHQITPPPFEYKECQERHIS